MISGTLSHGAARDMDEEHTNIAGWAAGALGLLLALVAWGREFFKQKHERGVKDLDVTSDMAKSLLTRIVALEAREEKDRKEAVHREDTLRTRIEGVEAEAAECQRSHEVLKEQHRVLLEEVADLREENIQLRKEAAQARGQNSALHEELETLYKQIGMKRTPPSGVPRG